jgi:hypothetical protein
MQTLAAIDAHLHNAHVTRMVAAYICPLDASPEDAARWGHYEIVADTRDDDMSCRVFRRACRGGHMPIVELLIERDVHNWDAGFYAACRGGHEDIVDLMFRYGVEDPVSGFSDACCGGNLAIMARVIDDSTTYMYCEHTSCHMGTLAVAKYVVEKAVTDDRIRVMLLAACRCGHADTVKYLLTHDAAKFCEQGMYAACRGGHRALIDMMETLGAHNWQYVLNGACEGGHLHAIKHVMGKLGVCDIPTTALIRTCESGSLPAVKYLLKLGADATATNVMHAACTSGNADIVKLLMARGNTHWYDGMRGASGSGHLPLVKFMAAQGASNWDACLTTAVYGDNIRVVRYMIDMGATNLEASLYNAETNNYIHLERYLARVITLRQI